MTDQNDRVQVYYDGACPLCTREIAFYRSRSGAEDIEWIDVANAPAEALPEGLSRDQALSRFHVRTARGRMVSGAMAFATVWAALPGWRWFGRIALFRPVSWGMEGAYRLFLRLRPWIRSMIDDPRAVSGPKGRK